MAGLDSLEFHARRLVGIPGDRRFHARQLKCLAVTLRYDGNPFRVELIKDSIAQSYADLARPFHALDQFIIAANSKLIGAPQKCPSTEP